MEKGTITLIVLCVIVISGISGFLFFRNEIFFSTPSLEKCNILKEGQNGAVNIVIFGQKEDANKYADYFLSSSPFKEYQEDFSFSYIDSYTPKCEEYKGVALLCHSRELIKKAGSCKYDYIVVLSSNNAEIRSSSYSNVMSLNTVHPLTVFLHEFGHSFANFGEEYTPASLPRGVENCASSCETFGADADGCFKGCSRTDYYRSIEIGVMRSLETNEFGKFNTKLLGSLIEKNIGSKITGKVIQDIGCEDRSYFLIEARNSDRGLEIIKVTKERGCAPSIGNGKVTYTITTGNGEKIEGARYSPDLIYTDAQGEGEIEGETFDSEENFFIPAEFVENAESVAISDGQTSDSQNIENTGDRPCQI